MLCEAQGMYLSLTWFLVDGRVLGQAEVFCFRDAVVGERLYSRGIVLYVRSIAKMRLLN